MTAAHTPGPWRQLVTRIDAADGYQICHLDMHGKSEAERDANRRLIAAAPGLLAALAVADETFAQNGLLACHAARQQIRAAVAKATGGKQ